jgi:hypothetical protein
LPEVFWVIFCVWHAAQSSVTVSNRNIGAFMDAV